MQGLRLRWWTAQNPRMDETNKPRIIKFSGPEDVYCAAVDAAGSVWVKSLLAFALVEQQRLEWAHHRLATTGQRAGPLDLVRWYEEQPPSVITRALDGAQAALDDYSTHSMDVFDDAYRRQVADDVVVGEIRKLSRLAPQVGISVLGGLIGSVTFTAFLIVFSWFVLNEPSPNVISKSLRQHQEQSSHEFPRTDPSTRP